MLIYLLACAAQTDLAGRWDAIEKDGMQFPIIYEGETAQDEFGDPDLQKAVQEMYIEVLADGTGYLQSDFVMTNIDESSYEFSYPMPMRIDVAAQPYKLVATDEETGEEITMLCTLTQAQLLSCTYTINEPDSPQGTLGFTAAEN